MSGYDFFSGFLGSLGQQMQDEQNRKRDLEDEDRLYQRKLSFEEAIAASKERQAVAAQERADKRARLNTPPQMREFMGEDGKLKQVPSRYFDGKFNDEGEATDVPQGDVGEAYEVNGRRMQPQRFGPPRDTGASEKGLNRAAQNARNANSVAATRYSADLGAQNRDSGGDKEANRIDMIARKASLEASAAFNDPIKRKAVLAKYGVPTSLKEPATERQLLDAVLRRVEDPYNRISPMPGARLLNEDGSEEYQPSNQPKPAEAEPEVTDAELEQEPDFMEFAENLILNAEAQKRPINQAEIRAKYREFYKQK